MPDGNVVTLPPSDMAWMATLTRGEKGLHAAVANALIVIGHDSNLAGLVAYDEFAHQVVVTRAPPAAYEGARIEPGPYPRIITDSDITLVQAYIQRVFGMRISQPIAQQAVLTAARQNIIHPVRQYLNALVWDGVPRLDTWLHVAFGVLNDPYHTAIGRGFLCAAVRRVFDPGCKFDYVLVLEGPQGLGKSRACAALFNPFFTDSLSHDLASKDAMQGIAGKWGVEMPELQALIKSSGHDSKAFFSREVDDYRPPYGKAFLKQPRQCVFIGTTNDQDWLSDSTGNRRYWPCKCTKAEAAWIAEIRDQLFAEAVVIERTEPEPLWLDDRTVAAAAIQEQASRVAEDTWTKQIMDWISNSGHIHVRVADVLQHAVGLQGVHSNRSAEMRVAAVLRLAGWERLRTREPGGKPYWGWSAP